MEDMGIMIGENEEDLWIWRWWRWTIKL